MQPVSLYKALETLALQYGKNKRSKNLVKLQSVEGGITSSFYNARFQTCHSVQGWSFGLPRVKLKSVVGIKVETRVKTQVIELRFSHHRLGLIVLGGLCTTLLHSFRITLGQSQLLGPVNSNVANSNGFIKEGTPIFIWLESIWLLKSCNTIDISSSR